MSIGPWRCIYGIVYRNLQPLLTPRMFHEFHVKPLLEAHMSTLLGASRRGRWQFRGTHVFRGARGRSFGSRELLVVRVVSSPSL